jgi:predicted transcriptional regulator
MVKTTIKIDDELLKTIKKIAIDKNETQNNLMNEYLRKGVNKELKPIKQESLKVISGLGTAPEPFNSVKELKKVENGE